jgi:signal transduction histidine kinase
VVQGIFQSISARLEAAQVAPAYVTALLTGGLAVVILGRNHRRPSNQAWACLLAFIGLWQGGTGLAQLSHREIFLRWSIFAGFLPLWPALLLQETLLAPWASLRRSAGRIRFQLWIALAGTAAFAPTLRSDAAAGAHPLFSALFWATKGMALGWMLWLLVRGIRLTVRRQVPAETRTELKALSWLIGLGPLLMLVVVLSGRLLQQAAFMQLAPLALWLGLGAAAVPLVREEVLAGVESRRLGRLFVARAVLYPLLAWTAIGFIRFVGDSGSGGLFFSVAVLALGLAAQPGLDRMLQRWAERGASSANFAGAQMAINILTESSFDLAELHRGYCAILRQWCEGAREVFLSDGTFAAVWPTEPIPLPILQLLAGGRGVTPESLEAEGTKWSEELAYLLRQHIGAVIGVGTTQGGRLIAAFAARRSAGPFGERELQEASELLASMLTGTQLVRLRQRMRGQDRLNFYAQYAPQFAHELRNGLYLQTQLLRAIAAGRGEEVLLADAQAGLESAAQIDRLCDHFFNVGALYKRPIVRLDLWELLENAVAKLRREFDGGSEIVLRLGFEFRDQAEIMGNAELLYMALHNLVKNAVEAGSPDDQTPRLELAASRQLDKVHLLVRDNGRGLPEDRRPDAFAPGKSHKRAGMGLGLSIARDCVEAMGGAVGVRFSGRTGTCFEITLACAEQMLGVSAPCNCLLPAE